MSFARSRRRLQALSFRRAAVWSRSRSVTTPHASPEAWLRLELVRVVRDPDHLLVELVRRLPDGYERAEHDPCPAARHQCSSRRDRALPGRVGLENSGQRRRVVRGGTNGRQRAVPVSLVELLDVARLEQLHAERALGRRARSELPADRRVVLDADASAPARLRDLELFHREDELLTGRISVAFSPAEVGRLRAGG